MAEQCLENSEVEIKKPPEPVLMMVRVKETVDGEIFNLGEVLVTNCGVLLDGEPGWGIAMGDDPERALCAAVIDAASRPEMSLELEDELSLQLAFVRKARRERWAGVQPTRVEFEEMA